MDELLAPWLRELRIRVEAVRAEGLVARMPWGPVIARRDGVVPGQAIMAFVDSAMVAAIAARLGGFQPMATVDMATTFLAPARECDVVADITFLRVGRRLVFASADVRTDDGTLVARVTTTWALAG
ncbi:MAG: PaaI family thioesterase [Alphaproteobacteria bacterium]|nr:PaaI family thioesterase [Alphaproteobacteria bacterium]